MIKLLIVIAIIYFISRFQKPQANPRPRPQVRENKIDITTTRFRRGIPQNNIKYRPENELGVISSDHLVYDT